MIILEIYGVDFTDLEYDHLVKSTEYINSFVGGRYTYTVKSRANVRRVISIAGGLLKLENELGFTFKELVSSGLEFNVSDYIDMLYCSISNGYNYIKGNFYSYVFDIHLEEGTEELLSTLAFCINGYNTQPRVPLIKDESKCLSCVRYLKSISTEHLESVIEIINFQVNKELGLNPLSWFGLIAISYATGLESQELLNNIDKATDSDIIILNTLGLQYINNTDSMYNMCMGLLPNLSPKFQELIKRTSVVI